MYIIKLGQSYMSDYVGGFSSKEECYQWLKDNDLSSENCQIIRIIPKGEY